MKRTHRTLGPSWEWDQLPPSDEESVGSLRARKDDDTPVDQDDLTPHGDGGFLSREKFITIYYRLRLKVLIHMSKNMAFNYKFYK